VRRIPWPLFIALLFVPSAVVVFWPAALYDNFFKFVAWVGLVLAPLTAVYLTDFFLLRRRRITVRDLYAPEGESRYSFWWGVNPAAFLAVGAGALIYYLLLDPITFSAAGIFTYTTASLPAFVVTAVVYIVLTVLWVRPAGKGGYHEPAASVRPTERAEAEEETPA
jgi:NCS1 family nucleobase:cation symporter-1